MKTIKNIMIAAMVLFAGNAMAQTLSAPEVSIEPGGKANLVVSYDSEKEFTGVQFTVYLTGVEMELNSSFVYVSAVDEQQAGYEAAINDTQDETGQIVIIKRQSKRVPALKNGGLISLSLVADDSFEGGKAVIKEMDAFDDD